MTCIWFLFVVAGYVQWFVLVPKFLTRRKRTPQARVSVGPRTYRKLRKSPEFTPKLNRVGFLTHEGVGPTSPSSSTSL